MTEVRIPQAGEAVTDASIGEWLVAEGAAVSAGDPLYVLVTDKAEMEIEAPCAGTVSLVGEVGVDYPVGHVIATIS